ncbi:conserved hypothetical protein [Lodderomyces elongisporus NRRL YB-4239]|uniref:Uncharacterized protein n=1 Tax=Lodderomyces elongisporus (strain ATCC 11503 / CBS 2605 / JCM 1781 / NBRC 1676 / NRRL YB-4239) TaxID=379508 RepID=A5E7T5_LODEL|nr:conserved hypothetical protein [Lodderomyces elongisporus NRRL YB-4239]
MNVCSILGLTRATITRRSNVILPRLNPLTHYSTTTFTSKIETNLIPTGQQEASTSSSTFTSTTLSSLEEAQQKYPDFNPVNEEQRQFIQRNTEKPLFGRKTYLMDVYKHMNETNQIILFVHHNNLSKNENKLLREELKKIGGQKNEEGHIVGGSKFTILKNSIYSLYLKSSHEADPAAKGNTAKNRNVQHPLLPLLVGPTGCITIKECEPNAIKQVYKVLKKFSDKLFVVGAKVEKDAFTTKQLDQFKEMPNRDGLRGQLVGLLTMAGGANLVRTLETPGHLLYLTMDTRANDMVLKNKGEEVKAEEEKQ